MEIDNEALIAAFADRVDAATSAMLDTACDASFTELGTVNLALVTVIFGAARNVFERNLGQDTTEDLRRQLILMCRSYLKASASTG